MIPEGPSGATELASKFIALPKATECIPIETFRSIYMHFSNVLLPTYHLWVPWFSEALRPGYIKLALGKIKPYFNSWPMVTSGNRNKEGNYWTQTKKIIQLYSMALF